MQARACVGGPYSNIIIGTQGPQNFMTPSCTHVYTCATPINMHVRTCSACARQYKKEKNETF